MTVFSSADADDDDDDVEGQEITDGILFGADDQNVLSGFTVDQASL